MYVIRKTESRINILIMAFGLILCLSCDQRSAEIATIKGIYGNPNPFWDKELDLNQLGVNAIFIHSGSINQTILNKARSEGLKVYAEFATLNGKDYVNKHPEAWAVNENGEKVQAATWFMGVCPTEQGFRKYRYDQLRELLLEYDLDGVWLDYVHWHAQFEDPDPILPETCFCNHCLTAFSEKSGIKLPEGTIPEKAKWILNMHDELWRDWRCSVVYDWTVEMKSILKEIKPEALLGLYHCPWDDMEFDGARRRILGLDFDLLKESIDVFSPMVYHGRMEREPEWVHEYVDWICLRLDIKMNSFPKVWPIVQAYDDPGIISSEEFETVLRSGLSGKSSGVMMFTSYAVAENEDKTKVMKKVYSRNKK